jgi:hypothetical protein
LVVPKGEKKCVGQWDMEQSLKLKEAGSAFVTLNTATSQPFAYARTEN